MYISEGMYTDKTCKETRSGSKVTEVTCYTLKGGGYVVFTRIKEEVDKEYGKDFRTVSEDAYACETCPDLETKDDSLQKLKKFAESLNL